MLAIWDEKVGAVTGEAWPPWEAVVAVVLDALVVLMLGLELVRVKVTVAVVVSETAPLLPL